MKINDRRYHLWRAVDCEDDDLDAVVAKGQDKRATLNFLRKSMKRYGRSEVIVTYNLRSYGAAIGIIGNDCRQEIGRRFTIKLRIPIGHFDRENGPCCASGKSDVFKNSPPFIFQSTTLKSGTPLLFMRHFQTDPKSCSVRVTSALFRLSSDLWQQTETG